MMSYLSKFFYLLGERKKRLFLLAFLFLFSSLLETLGIGLIGPFISIATNLGFIKQDSRINWIYNQFNFGSEINFLIFVGLVVVGIFYVKSFLSFFIQRYIFEFGFKQRGVLCSRLLHSYSLAPYTYHLTHNSSTLMQNMLNETETFSYKVIMPLLFAISNSIVTLAIVFLLIKTNVMAMFIIIGIVLLAGSIFYHFRHKIALWGKDRSDSYEEMIRIINHSLGGLKEVRVIGCEGYFEDQASFQMDKFAVSSAAYMSFTNLPRYVIEAFLITFLVVFTFIFLTFNPRSSQDLSSVLGIFAMASIRLLPAVGNVINSLNDVRYASYSMDKLYFDLQSLEKHQPKLSLSQTDALRSNQPMAFSKQIVLDKISYRYPEGANDALNQVSLLLKKGESIGLIGRSGAGKTTLVDVILGLLTPQSGDIKVDGISVYPNLRSWQNLIGYVPQSIFLIDDTLERNIAFGVPDHLIDQDKLSQAIQVAQLTELVEQLPEGISTVIGERGVRLSGGQRQRIGIARVLYHDRQILILDEATAALDNETESLVSEAVKALGGSKTIILIAHRLTTLEHCERIYVVEKGQIVKSGSYQDVVLRGQLSSPS
jgi:ATP-binding cassette, subfamily B, bacterial PglK